MIKLRTLLLHNYPFYIIMMIALLYFFIYSSFDFKSNITDLQNCTCRITNIIRKDYGFKIDCKLKHEKTILYYYAKSKEIDDLYNNYRMNLLERYKIAENELEQIESEDENEKLYSLMKLIGKKRGAVISGGEIDDEKTAKIILNDFRSGKLGKITLEKINEK